jgi:hypothetical protein
MARFAHLALVGLLAAPSLAAQSAPWAKTHVFSGIELAHDDQPITTFRPTVAVWGFLNDWTSVGARISTAGFRLGDTASRTLTIASATLSQTLLSGRVTLDGELGAVSRSWRTSADGVGNARVTAKPTAWSTVSARVERFIYTSTEASLSSDVAPSRFTADAGISLPSGWMGQAEWQDTRFGPFGFVPAGDNDVTSAFGWVLAPVPGVAPGALQVGYSFAAANSTKLMYGLANPNQRGTPNSPSFDFTGIYNPYYTPRDVRMHSALASLTTTSGRFAFHANGAYGFHATEDAPHIAAAVATPRGAGADVIEVPRSFSPWNLRATVTSAVTRAASLSVGAELMHTAFYSAQSATVSLDYTFGK